MFFLYVFLRLAKVTLMLCFCKEREMRVFGVLACPPRSGPCFGRQGVLEVKYEGWRME